ncbi:TRAP transporter substrate-binding protein [Roseixanthobacter pseudopolyaromaticivorans]|uniref:TRAP transporter substrate-binding protein n=1 Tax=Xanthobacteraceae TaxID=335928 RepID=UPI003727DF56
MNNLTRRAFTTAAIGAVTTFSILRRPASAAEFTYKFASNLAENHPMNVRLKAAFDAIRTETNGRLSIEMFANSQLGGDLEVLSQLRSGAVEFYEMAGAQLSSLVPLATLNGVGFAFNNIDDVWKAMDGDVGTLVKRAINKANLFVCDKMFDNGFRQITSSEKPVRSPDDLKGLTMRVPQSALSTSLFKAFGASPQGINFGETYTALQTHLVAAQENPLALIDSAKFYEVQKYVSMTNHMWDGLWIIGNVDTWKALPDDVKAITARHINDAAIAERSDVANLNESIVTKLKNAGMTFIEPDRAAFRQVLSSTSFYPDWKKRYGDEAWATLEKYTGKLG